MTFRRRRPRFQRPSDVSPRDRMENRDDAQTLHLLVAVPAALAAMTTLLFADPAFDAVVKQLTSEKPKFADRHQKLLDERYDLSNKPARA